MYLPFTSVYPASVHRWKGFYLGKLTWMACVRMSTFIYWKNIKLQKTKIFKVPSFWSSLSAVSRGDGFYRANDMMEKESCKVFRIFPNCGTCFKNRIFSKVPFLVISNGNSSCFQINAKRHDSGTKTLPAAWQDVDGWPLEQRQRLGRMQVPPLHPTWQIAKGKKW